MSTFSAWYKAYQDGKGVRQITYVCGPEKILVDEVISHIQREVAGSWGSMNLAVTETNQREVWELMDRRPMGNFNTLTVLYHAQELQDIARLWEWWKNKKYNPHHYLILVSDLDAAPRQQVGDPKEHKTEVVPHLRFGAAGWLVECKAFTQATVPTAVLWVRSKVEMTDAVAGHLLNRADGDLRLVRDATQKLRVFPGTITQSVINDLFTAVPRDSFVDALLALDKKTALAALDRMAAEDYSRTLGMLDSSLELAGVVHDFETNNKPRVELIRAAGKKAWLLPEVEKVAKHYDLKRRNRTRQLLLMADEALGGGETTGVFEALVALW